MRIFEILAQLEVKRPKGRNFLWQWPETYPEKYSAPKTPMAPTEAPSIEGPLDLFHAKIISEWGQATLDMLVLPFYDLLSCAGLTDTILVISNYLLGLLASFWSKKLIYFVTKTVIFNLSQGTCRKHDKMGHWSVKLAIFLPDLHPRHPCDDIA